MWYSFLPQKFMKNIVVLGFLILACQSCEIFDVVEFEEPNRFKGCCNTAPVEDTIGNTIIAVPNAITPNDDGLNDAFSIYSSDVMQISSLQVMEQNQILGIDRKNIPLKRGWTKVWIPRNASGKIVQGLYNYTMTVNELDGTEKTLTGQFCAFICGEAKVETIPQGDCDFRNQLDKNGHFSTEIPPQDTCHF